MEEMLESYNPSSPVPTIKLDTTDDESPSPQFEEDSPLEVISISGFILNFLNKVNDKQYWKMINEFINNSEEEEEDLESPIFSPEPIRSNKPRSTKKVHFGPELTIIPVYRLLEPFIGWVGKYNRKTKRNPDGYYRMGLSNEVGEKEVLDFDEYTTNQEMKRAIQGFSHCEDQKLMDRFISTYPGKSFFPTYF